MDIRHNKPYSGNQPRSRSRSRTRNSTANLRSTSSNKRPFVTRHRSLSSTSISKLVVTPTILDQERAVPTVQATLDNTLPLGFFKEDVIALIKTLRISKWHRRSLAAGSLSLNRISGALTNSIYKIEFFDAETNTQLPSLLLRVYGKNVESIIDRDLELKTLIKLSQKNIGPRLLGIFSNGRFEQFLEGYLPLNKSSIRDEAISQMIGRRMKDLHTKIELDAEDLKEEMPMVWKLIEKWVDVFEREIYPSFGQNNVADESVFLTSFQHFKQLIAAYKNWLFSFYDTESISDNYRFCHNDTQYGNILLHESFDPSDIVVAPPTDIAEETDESKIIKNTSNRKDHNLAVIDFEYSGHNFVAFDLANHFSEWMADYHDPEKSYFLHEHRFPTQLQQINFIKSYVEYDFQLSSSNFKPQNYQQKPGDALDLVQKEIGKLFNECVVWRPAVQLYWCLWGLIQNGPIKNEALDINSIGSSSEEKGIGGTYSITTGIGTVWIDENAIVEDEAIADDDEFDYLKYSQQKASLAIGDMISFGILDKSLIQDLDAVKYLDCSLMES